MERLRLKYSMCNFVQPGRVTAGVGVVVGVGVGVGVGVNSSLRKIDAKTGKRWALAQAS